MKQMKMYYPFPPAKPLALQVVQNKKKNLRIKKLQKISINFFS